MKSLIPWKRRSEERSVPVITERPGDLLAQVRRELDSLFDRFFNDWPLMPGRDYWPTFGWGFDVEDRENELVVRADAPGFEPNEFNVEIVGDTLVLKAEHKDETKQGNGYRYRHGRLCRRVLLPHGVETEKIEASYRNGVLEIRVPKGDKAKGKRIEIKAG